MAQPVPNQTPNGTSIEPPQAQAAPPLPNVASENPVAVDNKFQELGALLDRVDRHENATPSTPTAEKLSPSAPPASAEAPLPKPESNNPAANSQSTSENAFDNRLAQGRLGLASSLLTALRCRDAATAAHCVRVALSSSTWAVALNLTDTQREKSRNRRATARYRQNRHPRCRAPQARPIKRCRTARHGHSSNAWSANSGILLRLVRGFAHRPALPHLVRRLGRGKRLRGNRYSFGIAYPGNYQCLRYHDQHAGLQACHVPRSRHPRVVPMCRHSVRSGVGLSLCPALRRRSTKLPRSGRPSLAPTARITCCQRLVVAAAVSAGPLWRQPARCAPSAKAVGKHVRRRRLPRPSNANHALEPRCGTTYRRERR